MMSRQTNPVSLFWAVALSTFCALVLMAIPLPQWLFFYWPDWIALVMVYWALSTPGRVGPLSGFIVGIFLEVLFVRKFGIEGLGLATLVFIVNRANLQLRVLSLWQQTVVIGLFIAIYKLITGWLNGMMVDFTITSEYWYSLVGDVLVWPFVAILLGEVRRKARIT